MSADDQPRLAQYGLTWGTAHVTCLGSGSWGRTIRVGSSKNIAGVEIHVSPGGRNIRVFRDGKELR